MEFQETEIQTELRNLTKKIVDQEIRPLVEKDEESETFREEMIQKLGEAGLTGIPVPEAYGGAGLGYSEYIVVLEEISKACASYAISVAVTGLSQVILNLFGSEEQKKKFIPPLASGKAIGAFALSEASSGTDAASLRCKAEKQKDHYLLNGTKLWCTQADSAKTILLMARTGEDGPKGISTLIVDSKPQGMSLGKKEKKMGLNISHTMEVIFENCKIPSENLVSKEGEGFNIAMTALDSGRITIASIAVGVAQEALDVALQYSKEREQFGKPISHFQGVSFMLADMATQIESARLLTHRAAWLKDQGLPYTKEAAMAKMYATDTAMKVTTDAVQILGGAGYTKDFSVERLMRESKVFQIFEGTNQIQRQIIGKHLTKES